MKFVSFIIIFSKIISAQSLWLNRKQVVSLHWDFCCFFFSNLQWYKFDMFSRFFSTKFLILDSSTFIDYTCSRWFANTSVFFCCLFLVQSSFVMDTFCFLAIYHKEHSVLLLSICTIIFFCFQFSFPNIHCFWSKLRTYQ